MEVGGFGRESFLTLPTHTPCFSQYDETRSYVISENDTEENIHLLFVIPHAHA